MAATTLVLMTASLDGLRPAHADDTSGSRGAGSGAARPTASATARISIVKLAPVVPAFPGMPADDPFVTPGDTDAFVGIDIAAFPADAPVRLALDVEPGGVEAELLRAGTVCEDRSGGDLHDVCAGTPSHVLRLAFATRGGGKAYDSASPPTIRLLVAFE